MVGERHYVFIDPGETSGVAEFSATGQVLAMHQFRIPELYNYLDSLVDDPPAIIVFEEYKIFAHKAKSHINSEIPTIQVIGAIKYGGHRCGSKVIKQESQFKPIGYMYGGFQAPKDHSKSHGPDAMAHGFYYLVKNKVIGVKPLGSTQKDRKA